VTPTAAAQISPDYCVEEVRERRRAIGTRKVGTRLEVPILYTGQNLMQSSVVQVCCEGKFIFSIQNKSCILCPKYSDWRSRESSHTQRTRTRAEGNIINKSKDGQYVGDYEGFSYKTPTCHRPNSDVTAHGLWNSFVHEECDYTAPSFCRPSCPKTTSCTSPFPLERIHDGIQNARRFCPINKFGPEAIGLEIAPHQTRKKSIEDARARYKKEESHKAAVQS
jgi:hypothetical protein